VIVNMHTNETDAAPDWLEQALRSDGVEHRLRHVDDDGFTARVMARLPAPATLPAWRRPVIALLWLCAAAVAAVGAPGLFEDAFRNTVALLVGHRLGVADVLALLIVLGATTWGMLVYAVKVK
jgi:hypothetical protein